MTLTEGINEIKLSFDDPAWSRVGGWDAAPAAMPGKTGITAVQFESAGGAYTLNVDDIRFLKESELDGGGDNPPVEVPEEPTLPADPYKLDDFEGYANSASLGYNSLWAVSYTHLPSVPDDPDRDEPAGMLQRMGDAIRQRDAYGA